MSKRIELPLDVTPYDIQNYFFRNGRVKKMPGTVKYNTTALSFPIKWQDRYYGIKADGSFIKKTFCYSNGTIYMGDDSLQTLTSVKAGLQIDCQVESLVEQVAGNSRMYLFNGYDYPYYYEGDDLGTWVKSAIPYKFQQAVIKDQRLWGFERNTSSLIFSRNLYPEDYNVSYAGTIIIGNERDSFIRRIVLLGNSLYIFKNDSIWVLRGSTRATYSVDLLVPNMGLLAQKAWSQVASAGVFVCQQDKEIYEFTGTPNPRMISKNIIKDKTFADLIDKNEDKTDLMTAHWDMINRLFRLSYKGFPARENHANSEVIFPTDEFREGGSPKWSISHGAGISCYSNWNRQGDHQLVTGRSDKGLLMIHNRGHNFDDVAMETFLVLDDYTPSAGHNCDFSSYFIRGIPSSGTINIKTFLNGRYSTGTSQNLTDQGETEVIPGSAITISSQIRFHNWMPILTGYNHGEQIGFSIEDSTKDKDIEIETIVLEYNIRERITTSLVGG